MKIIEKKKNRKVSSVSNETLVYWSLFWEEWVPENPQECRKEYPGIPGDRYIPQWLQSRPLGKRVCLLSTHQLKDRDW